MGVYNYVITICYLFSLFEGNVSSNSNSQEILKRRIELINTCINTYLKAIDNRVGNRGHSGVANLEGNSCHPGNTLCKGKK